MYLLNYINIIRSSINLYIQLIIFTNQLFIVTLFKSESNFNQYIYIVYMARTKKCSKLIFCFWKNTYIRLIELLLIT